MRLDATFKVVAIVRILIDGYSLLHNWPQLAPGKPRHSEAARDELVHILTRYHDAEGTPITVFFDGTGKRKKAPDANGEQGVEVLFSHDGKTADDLIERAAHRFKPYGEVLAVTDDTAERDTVIGLGSHASSCDNFIRMVESTLTEFSEGLKDYNRRERNRFRQS